MSLPIPSLCRLFRLLTVLILAVPTAAQADFTLLLTKDRLAFGVEEIERIDPPAGWGINRDTPVIRLKPEAARALEAHTTARIGQDISVAVFGTIVLDQGKVADPLDGRALSVSGLSEEEIASLLHLMEVRPPPKLTVLLFYNTTARLPVFVAGVVEDPATATPIGYKLTDDTAQRLAALPIPINPDTALLTLGNEILFVWDYDPDTGRLRVGH